VRDAEATAAYERIRAFMRQHPAGCCLHIVLDDGNLENGFVDYCLEYATTNGHEECMAVAKIVQRMSKTQRKKAWTRFSR
jgi:hypothetical protein